MSHVLMLSSDTVMPEFHGLEGFCVEETCYSRECPEINRFVKRTYYYSMDIIVNNSALLELKKYLTDYTEPGSEVELWSIWLGGDYTKHYPSMPRISNIPSADLKEIEESIDAYREDYFNPKIRKKQIYDLSINDIMFINNDTGTCLVVCH